MTRIPTAGRPLWARGMAAKVLAGVLVVNGGLGMTADRPGERLRTASPSPRSANHRPPLATPTCALALDVHLHRNERPDRQRRAGHLAHPGRRPHRP
jgi:hypothetical protein